MATNLDLDQKLLTQAMKIGKMRSKKDTVNQALQEFIQRRGQKKIRELRGKIDFREDWDYKKERNRRAPAG